MQKNTLFHFIKYLSLLTQNLTVLNPSTHIYLSNHSSITVNYQMAFCQKTVVERNI